MNWSALVVNIRERRLLIHTRSATIPTLVKKLPEPSELLVGEVLELELLRPLEGDADVLRSVLDHLAKDLVSALGREEVKAAVEELLQDEAPWIILQVKR